MPSLESDCMRTVDVARHTGYSVQQVRNLERDGVLPPAARAANGYRSYGRIHLHSALAYRTLAIGIGPLEAKRIVRAFHLARAAEAFALLDTAHARLASERNDLHHAIAAAEAISAEPLAEVRAADAMNIAELATALGVRTSTLRHWDAEGLVVPDRRRPRGERRYTPARVRDARVVHQLRRAGYRIPPLRALMPELRSAGGSSDIRSALMEREEALTERSRALLDGTAALSAVLAARREADRARGQIATQSSNDAIRRDR